MDCWQQIYPAAEDRFSKADDQAMVLRGNIRGTKILLLSDLGRSGQSALLNESTNLSADIVVSGIPGGNEPLCDELIKASQPKVIIITDSEFPANLRVNTVLHERLESHGVPVIYTRTAGAVTILFNNGGWEIRTMNTAYFIPKHEPEQY